MLQIKSRFVLAQKKKLGVRCTLSTHLALCSTFSRNKLRACFQRIIIWVSQLSLKMLGTESGISVIVMVNKTVRKLVHMILFLLTNEIPTNQKDYRFDYRLTRLPRFVVLILFFS